MLVLIGCSTPSAPIPTAATAEAGGQGSRPPDVCLVWSIVHYSRADTPDTIEQVRLNNAARRALCGG